MMIVELLVVGYLSQDIKIVKDIVDRSSIGFNEIHSKVFASIKYKNKDLLVS